MRIAVWHNLLPGGASRALHGHLTALQEAGHDLEIWTSDLHPGADKRFAEFGKVNVVHLPGNAGFLQNTYKNPLAIRHTRQIIRLLKTFQQTCAEQINRQGFDLVFVNSCSVTYMPFISLFLRPPSVIYLGEPYRWLYEASPENRWQAPAYKNAELKKIYRDYQVNYSRRIQVREEIRAARAYTRILVNSYYSRESVCKAYGIEPDVCRLGVDTALFTHAAVPGKENYVVSIGLLYYPKGADRAVYLLSKIAPQLRPKLYWISNGTDSQYLADVQQQAHQLGVELVPLINVSDAELVQWVSKARFMIYTPRLEPLGLAPLEANACGTCVIGIAEAGVRETITPGRNGFLIDGVEDERFCTYAEPLLQSEKSSLDMGMQARAFVEENWSYRHLKKNMLAAVNRVVTQQHPAHRTTGQ